MTDATWNPDFKPEAALNYFKRKGLSTSFAWQDVWHEEHDAAFTIAKMMDLDLLRDMRDAVEQALANGSTFGDFRKQVQPMLMKRGWWGRAEMPDPLTGEIKNVQLGSVRRLQTIFRTNMQIAYAAGDWEQITDTADSAPYLMYDAVDDNRTRPQHRAWDGTVLRFDDPWWQSHRPPCGWNCRCSTIQLSAEEVKAMGKATDDPPPPALRPARDYIDKRSGLITAVPDGVDPGFGYNPGVASLRSHALQLFGEKVAQVPAMMGARAWQSLIDEKPSLMRALDESFGRFIDSLVGVAHPGNQSHVVGVLPVKHIQYLIEHESIEPVSAEVFAKNNLVEGVKRDRKISKQQQLTVSELKRIPTALRDYEDVRFDVDEGTLIYILPADEKKQKIVVRPNMQVKKPKRDINSVRSAYKVNASDFPEGRYKKLPESLR